MELGFLKDNHFFLVLLLAGTFVFTYISNRITSVEENARGKEYIKSIIMTVLLYSAMYYVYTTADVIEPMLHGTPDF